METQVSMIQGQPEALEELAAWLRQEPELAGFVHALREPLPGSAMGTGLVGAVSVALGAGGAVTVFASSLRAWLAQPRWRNVELRVQTDQADIVLRADSISGSTLDAMLSEATRRSRLNERSGDR